MYINELGRQRKIARLEGPCSKQEIQEFMAFVKNGPIVDKDKMVEALDPAMHLLNETYKNAGVLKIDRKRALGAMEVTVFDGTAQYQEASFNRVVSMSNGDGITQG